MRFLPLTICQKWMNFVSSCSPFMRAALFTLLLVIWLPLQAQAVDEFSFDLEEIEKSPLGWGGYVELKWEHLESNEGSVFSLLNLGDNPGTNIDRLSGSLQLDGSYSREFYSFIWLLKATGVEDDFGWNDTLDLFSAYLNIKPLPAVTLSLGKKPYKWGKGYAWNPVGFINRRKDPNNPDESLEGYVTTEADFIKSFSGALQTVALTTVVLPVYDDINDDFGEVDNSNFAAKLYFLVLDTDIDFILLAGDSRPDQYGVDFSKNISTNFEVHGELAWAPNARDITFQEDGSYTVGEEENLSFLLGLRYLTENDITSIVEYYHNGAGYTEEEMNTFFQFAKDAGEIYRQTASRVLLDRAIDASLKGYGKPQPGRDYLYARFSGKEPFDILYFTPALTAIVNLADGSFSLTPELLYTGFTNWEMRLRFNYMDGSSYSEFGEKQNSSKLEIRLRYFF